MLKRVALIGGLVGVVALPTPASAEDFRFLRPGDPVRIFRPDEVLAIALPGQLARSELNSLFLEMDGVDITQLVTLEGQQVLYKPVANHSPGAHSLRLVRKTREGRLLELSQWNFTVSGAPPVEEVTTASGVVDATYSALPYDTENPAAQPPRHNLVATTQFQGATQVGGWQFSARGNGYLNSQDTYNPAGDYAEIGEYLVSAEQAADSGNLLLRMGNHDVGADNLLMRGFTRRGVSARADVLDNRVTVIGFSQDPALHSGNHNGFGVADTDQLASGVNLKLRPFDVLGKAFELELTTYTASGTSAGSMVSGLAVPQSSGSGYQFGITSVVVPDYLTMRFQQAFSDYDYDRHDTGTDSNHDDARRLTFTFTPLGSQVAESGRLELWTVDLTYHRAGTFYESLLSQSEEADREKFSIGSTYATGGFSLAGEFARLSNNVNDYSILPTDSGINSWAQASYAPEDELWGRPVFFLGGMASEEWREKTPAAYAGSDLDQSTQSLNGGFSLGFEDVTTTLTHTYTVYSDRINTGTGYETHLSALQAEFKPAGWATLRPGLQVEQVYQATGDSRAYYGTLGADVVFVAGEFWNTTDYSFMLNDNAPVSRDTHNLSSEWTWLVQAPAKNAPGYGLGFAVMHGNLTNPSTRMVQTENDTRLFLRLKTSAPFGIE